MTCVEALMVALDNGKPPYPCPDKPRRSNSADYAAWRFLQAWCTTPELGPDHAVLLRQVVRWVGGSLSLNLPQALRQYLSNAGLHCTGGSLLGAVPFVPSWLSDDCISQTAGIDAVPVYRGCEESVPGEGFLASLGCDSWRSQAQKEAAWRVLTAPPLSTTLVALPTGAGKSLCFQLLALFSRGLTVVVVPTIALAIAQYAAAVSMLRHLNPRYYSAEDSGMDPVQVAADVRSGQCRLLFTSPEACVSGRLRSALDDCAGRGLIENLVIDEAHIVETWGAFFRVDFQMLSTLRTEWLRKPDSQLRTLLLSATTTPECRHTLRLLFGTDGGWREFISQRLRPEIAYYCHSFSREEHRHAAVLQCVWQMPRPAILYTTEVEEANEWYRVLRDEHGFQRIGCFTGETSSEQRRKLLSQWVEEDRIDLMIATSAFGLGVDKGDVRSVVHCCLPENIDRYYQEVGRAGRDGTSAISVLLPVLSDVRTAEALLPRLMTASISQERWEAMWEEREEVSEEDGIWRVCADTRRLGLKGARTWRQNEQWNKRLLLQLVRAGMLRLIKVESRQDAAKPELVEWFTLQIGQMWPASPNVGALLEPQRQEELRLAARGLEHMKAFLAGGQCISRILRATYGPETVRVCSGCPQCRREQASVGSCPPLPIDTNGEGQSRPPALAVVASCPGLSNLQAGEFVSMLRECVETKGIRRFICSGEWHRSVLEHVAAAFPLVEHAYRVDVLDPEVLPSIGVNEDVAVLHISRIYRAALALAAGRSVVHLLIGVHCCDGSGRYHLEHRDAKLYTDWDLWVREA